MSNLENYLWINCTYTYFFLWELNFWLENRRICCQLELTSAVVCVPSCIIRYYHIYWYIDAYVWEQTACFPVSYLQSILVWRFYDLGVLKVFPYWFLGIAVIIEESIQCLAQRKLWSLHFRVQGRNCILNYSRLLLITKLYFLLAATICKLLHL